MRQVFLNAQRAALEYADLFARPPPYINVYSDTITDAELDAAVQLFLYNTYEGATPAPLQQALLCYDKRLAGACQAPLKERFLAANMLDEARLHCSIEGCATYQSVEVYSAFPDLLATNYRGAVAFLAQLLRRAPKKARAGFFRWTGFESTFPHGEFALYVLNGDYIVLDMLRLICLAAFCVERPQVFYQSLIFVAADGSIAVEHVNALFRALELLAPRVESAGQLCFDLHLQLQQYFRAEFERRRGAVQFYCAILSLRAFYRFEALALLEDLYQISKPTRREMNYLAYVTAQVIQMYYMEEGQVNRFLRFLLGYFEPGAPPHVKTVILYTIGYYFAVLSKNAQAVEILKLRAFNELKYLTEKPCGYQIEMYIHLFSILKALVESGVDIDSLVFEKAKLTLGSDPELDELVGEFLKTGQYE